jgi:3-deoxy-7-phosphoheptulonate synthase
MATLGVVGAMHAGALAVPVNAAVVKGQSLKAANKGIFYGVRSAAGRVVSVRAVQTPVSKPNLPETDAAPAVDWSIDSWKTKTALQMPIYEDLEELEKVEKSLSEFPPLVFAGEARNLEERLAEAARGNAFLLQGGDCAESFKEFKADNIRDTFRVLLQMGVVLMFGGQMPVVKVCEDSPFSSTLSLSVASRVKVFS